MQMMAWGWHGGRTAATSRRFRSPPQFPCSCSASAQGYPAIAMVKNKIKFKKRRVKERKWGICAGLSW